MQRQLDGRRSVEKLIPETYTDSLTAVRQPRSANPNPTDPDKAAGFSYTTMRIDDGRAMRLIVPRGFGISDTMAERQIEAREGWLWKDDIRDRVDVAMRISKSLPISHPSSTNSASKSTTTGKGISSTTTRATPSQERSRARRSARDTPRNRLSRRWPRNTSAAATEPTTCRTASAG